MKLIVVFILIANSHSPTQRNLTIALYHLGLTDGMNWLLRLAWGLKNGRVRDRWGPPGLL